MNIVASLKRKIGPLPAWGWGAALAAVLLVYRRLRGTTTATTSATTDLGAAAANGSSSDPNAIGAYGGSGSGGGGAGLTPSDQTIASPDLSGPGTPFIFDPLGGSGDDTADGGDTGSGGDAGTGGGGAGDNTYDPGDISGFDRSRFKTPHGSGIDTPKHRSSRPKTSRGQKSKKSRHASIELVSEHGAGQNHPVSAAHPAPAPARAQTHTAPTPAVRRAAPAAHVDTGARTPTPAKKAPPSPPVRKAPPPQSNVHRPGRQM